MTGKPSAARALLWLESEAIRVKDLSSQVDAEMTEARKAKTGENGLTFGDVLHKAATAMWHLGYVQGVAEELRMIDQNLALYYRAKGEQDARRSAKRAAFFGALAQAAQNASRAYEDSFDTTWSATCMQIGFMTRCSGH